MLSVYILHTGLIIGCVLTCGGLQELQNEPNNLQLSIESSAFELSHAVMSCLLVWVKLVQQSVVRIMTAAQDKSINYDGSNGAERLLLGTLY